MSGRNRLQRRPLAVLAAAAVTGILLIQWLPYHGAWLAASFAMAVVSIALLFICPHRIWVCLLTVSTFGILHWFHLGQTRHHPLYEWLLNQPDGAEVDVEGRVIRSLRKDLPGHEPGEALFHFSRVTASHLGMEWQGGGYLCVISPDKAPFHEGTYRLTGKLRLPPPADNPGQLDSRNYSLGLGLVGRLNARKVEQVELNRWPVREHLLAAANRCREWMIATLSRDLETAETERTIILAMALGATDTATPEIQRPFLLSGTLHIFAVSGLHVVIVGYVFQMLLRPLGLPRATMMLALLALIFGYAFLTGFRPSAVRAALMASVLLLGPFLARKSDLLNSLGAAALVILVTDTNQVFAPGFQLSFGVLAAIALLQPIFEKPCSRIIDPDPFIPRALLTSWQRRRWHGLRWVCGLFTVSAAAWVGSLPFIIWHFNLLTPVSLISNAILVPASFLVLATSILTLLCGGLHLTFIQTLFANANFALAKGTFWFAGFFADLPAAHWHVPELTSNSPIEMTVLRLPAGGSATHVRAGGTHWLLDTGSKQSYEWIMRRYMPHRGINSLHGVILSHNDYEHAGAVPSLQINYPPAHIMRPMPAPGERFPKNSSFQVIFGTEAAFTETQLSAGDHIDLQPKFPGQHEARVLYPPAGKSQRRADDRTLIVQFPLGSWKVLWCNDAGFLTEKYLLEQVPHEVLRSEVIIRNQHAGDFSMLPEFLDVVQPKFLISSNQGFPAEQKLPLRLRKACEERGITLLDQAQTGAVTLRAGSDNVEIHAHRGGALWPLPSQVQPQEQ